MISDLSESDFEESDKEDELETLEESIVPETGERVDENEHSDELFSNYSCSNLDTSLT